MILYTLAQKTETSLIQLFTNHIGQIRKELTNSPNKELIDRFISEYPYPRNFDLELDVDESIYEIDSFIHDPRFYSLKIRNSKVCPILILAIQRIKWQQLLFGKGKAPLMAQQIARAERADRRRVDKEIFYHR